MKGKDFVNLPEIWKDAERALQCANFVIIIGYSMPYYDEAARNLIKNYINYNAFVYLIGPSADKVMQNFNCLPNKNKKYLKMGFREFLLKWKDGA